MLLLVLLRVLLGVGEGGGALEEGAASGHAAHVSNAQVDLGEGGLRVLQLLLGLLGLLLLLLGLRLGEREGELGEATQRGGRWGCCCYCCCRGDRACCCCCCASCWHREPGQQWPSG